LGYSAIPYQFLQSKFLRKRLSINNKYATAGKPFRTLARILVTKPAKMNKRIMHIQSQFVLMIAVLAIGSGLPSKVIADELKDAKVTQVIQDVRVLPLNASPRPAAVNDDVHRGTAVQTGPQSRSELTFKDQTITRLGEKTIFSVSEGSRTIELGSGQFLLYVPKKAGGAKVKTGPVTAAITG
jgi:hypothetical protein